VEIPHTRGLDGHSDADVLVHAIMDALLGAARIPGARDIGELFPDTDAAFKDAYSLKLLRNVKECLGDAGFVVLDIDSVIVAQAPRLSPYRDQMRSNIAEALAVSIDQVGIKATTTERLGFQGREEGISAHAVALLGVVETGIPHNTHDKQTHDKQTHDNQTHDKHSEQE